MAIHFTKRELDALLEAIDFRLAGVYDESLDFKGLQFAQAKLREAAAKASRG